MSEFKREERYVVIKLKDLDLASALALRGFLCRNNIPTRECVVVEPDWPIYEIVWHLVERLATGQRLPFMTDEDPEALQAELARSDNRAQRQRQLEAQIQGEINELECKVLELETERDALAAHVERLTAAARELAEQGYMEDLDYLDVVISEAPSTSLARMKAQWQAEWVESLPTTCDGIEQEAFEAWARSKQMDLSLHPLHYLFLHAETNAARGGWREAILYCRRQAEEPTE